MKIAVVGTGYVGLVVGTCFAENGHTVTCVDVDEGIIENLKKGKIPIYEPGLEELVEHNTEEERLFFTTSLAEAVEKSLLVFLCVGTPEGKDGRADMSQVFGAARDIGRAMTGYRIIVSKSTCPVGTVDEIREIVAAETDEEFDIVSNPEFLKEGAAVDDFMRPDRVVIGTDDVRVEEIMKELYEPLVRTGRPILTMNLPSAEFTKYACNTMLASRISMMNELATIAEAYGADIGLVREGMAADTRIGTAFLFPGLGYGGSCFPKDVQALAGLAQDKGVPCHMTTSIGRVNEEQRQRFVDCILGHYDHRVEGLRFAIWGASFKPRTDDLREAPSLHVIDALIAAGAQVTVYDPVAGPGIEARYGSKVTVAQKNYEALADAVALIVCTEWNEFRRPDFERMAELMASKVIFDGRNIYNPKTMAKNGFRYFSIGRPSV